MTYTKEELLEMTKRELILLLEDNNVTRIGTKKTTKYRKDDLADYILDNFCIQAKEDSEVTVDIVPEEDVIETVEETEETPVVETATEEPATEVDIDALLSKAKTAGEEAKSKVKASGKGSKWIPNAKKLLEREDLKNDKGHYIIPMDELKAILQLPNTDKGQLASAYRYSCDWTISSGMTAGICFARLGFRCSLSLAKGKEKLTIKPMTDEEYQAFLIAKNYEPFTLD